MGGGSPFPLSRGPGWRRRSGSGNAGNEKSPDRSKARTTGRGAKPGFPDIRIHEECEKGRVPQGHTSLSHRFGPDPFRCRGSQRQKHDEKAGGEEGGVRPIRPERSRAKAGLNRAILSSCWGLFVLFLSYNSRRAGKLVLKVSPQFSSQECARCGHIHPDNRPSLTEFVCQRCGLTDMPITTPAVSLPKGESAFFWEGKSSRRRFGGAGSENLKH